MEQKKNIRNISSHNATATESRFYFQLPGSPDAAFGGDIVLL